MARLNEPVMAPDGMELLRRKFLRQNRDIARINSTQSLRIRSLENECARMLSENLELRGQILRLETEMQESRAQRIADHALEIKEKMEAQLLEWGTMLASLGHEPIPRNRSPRARKKVRRDPSLGLAGLGSPRFRRRNTSELEAAAIQEGRLPPLWENKPCPRETLNRDEILALCSEAAETDSPDIGPPPVSRFVDEEPVKIDLPTRTLPESPRPSVEEESLSKPAPRSSPETTPETQEAREIVTKKPEPTATRPQPKAVIELAAPNPRVANANLKRKVRDDDEKENAPGLKVGGDPVKAAKAQSEKAATRPTQRPIKTITTGKEDGRDNITANYPALAPRKALGAKSANAVITSPKKAAKGSVLDEIAKAKAEVKSSERAKDKPRMKKREDKPKPVEIPAPEPAPASISVPAAVIEIEPELLSSEPNLSAPDSPEPTARREDMRDTPPPADISSTGETGRAGRRARSAVSYAEPNLRDKMRRPSKQLFDAVAGEGKTMRRTSQSKPQEMPSVKSEEKASGWKTLPGQGTSVAERADDVTASPLAQKVSRGSPRSILDQEDNLRVSASSSSKLAIRPMSKKLEDSAAREAEITKLFDSPDVYEFPGSSPSSKTFSKEASTEESQKPSNTRGGKSKRLSSVLREDVGNGGLDANEKGRRSRKRASMMVQKTTSGFDADTSTSVDGDSSFNSNSSGDTEVSTRAVSMRRRSMML